MTVAGPRSRTSKTSLLATDLSTRCQRAVKQAGEPFFEGPEPFETGRLRPRLLNEPGSAGLGPLEFVRLRQIDPIAQRARCSGSTPGGRLPRDPRTAVGGESMMTSGLPSADVPDNGGSCVQ